MTIIRTNGPQIYNVGQSQNFNFDLNWTPEENQLLFAVIGINASNEDVTSITQSNVTWTKQLQASNNVTYPRDLELWVGVTSFNPGSNLAFSLSVVPLQGKITICEYSGLLASGFLDKSSFSVGSGTTNISTGASSATSQNNELWIGCIMNVQNNDFIDTPLTTPLNGFTLVDGTQFARFPSMHTGYLEKIVSATGRAETGASNPGGFANEVYAAIIATFKADLNQKTKLKFTEVTALNENYMYNFFDAEPEYNNKSIEMTFFN